QHHDALKHSSQQIVMEYIARLSVKRKNTTTLKVDERNAEDGRNSLCNITCWI
ncbi:hypothetical protein SK128_002333, partial [Halocaridina rubra]